ncbi:MAG: tetratricopeptide repeat protein [Burkholderiales bacterium]|nr:tetratricopeptide repeat protein [Burkholderiales bacterium]MDQ3195656.1 tetratricopeptide repeat protein [Pseudomonadota bacterium]
MTSYTLREVQQIAGLTRSVIAGFIQAGFVEPALGKRREYRFTFQDLIVMRAAQGLASAKISARTVSCSLKKLREQIPAEIPITGLRISARGNRVLVRHGDAQWEPHSGQCVFDFEVTASGSLSFLQPVEKAAASAEEWFREGIEKEDQEPMQAMQCYRCAIQADPRYCGALINLGRMLHEGGELVEAEAVYEKAIRHCAGDPLPRFNLGVLLEDLGRRTDAIAAYSSALEADANFADAHYNLGLLYEQQGRAREALRHLSAYRKAQMGKT